MRNILAATVALSLAAPAAASNMGIKLGRSIPVTPVDHIAIGVNFSNGRVLNIVTSNQENPDILMSDLFTGSGCTALRATKVYSPDSCLMGGNPALGCTRFVTTCSLIGYGKSTLGFKLEHAVNFLAQRSTTKGLEVWDGNWAVDARKQAYVSVPFLGEDAEAHATVSTATTQDQGVLSLLGSPVSRFIDIPIYWRAAHKVGKSCSVLLTTGTCTGSVRSANAASTRSVFEFPAKVLSFP